MRIHLIALFVAASVFSFGTTPPKKKASKHTTTAKRKGKSTAAFAGVSGPRNRQIAPTPERYTEIQQALVSKGYLKSEPNGVWDAQSTDALRRFQADQKLDPSGKLNAPSLIGLGLGGQTATSQMSAPAVPAPSPR